MESTEGFDVFHWLNGHRGREPKLSRESLDSVMCFALMWNLFEDRACGRNATPATICRAVVRLYEQGRLSLGDFRPYLAHFQGRYLREGAPNPRFDSLHLERSGCRQLVADALQGKLTDVTNVVQAVLLVVLRLRNNMFHGEKYVFSLPPQDESFAVANQLLATFLDLVLVAEREQPPRPRAKRVQRPSDED